MNGSAIQMELNNREAKRLQSEAKAKEDVREEYVDPSSWMGSCTIYGSGHIVPSFVAELQSKEAGDVAEHGHLILDTPPQSAVRGVYNFNRLLPGRSLYQYRDSFVLVFWQQEMEWKETDEKQFCRTRFDGGEMYPVYVSGDSKGPRKPLRATTLLSHMTERELEVMRKFQ
jgi:hypothetical protein